MNNQKPKKKSKLKHYIETIKQSNLSSFPPTNPSKISPPNPSSLPHFIYSTDYSQKTPLPNPSFHSEFLCETKSPSSTQQQNNFEKEVSLFKNEIETLKQKTIKTKEKILIFTKLIRNYAKKLKVLGQILNNNTVINSDKENDVQMSITNNIINTIKTIKMPPKNNFLFFIFLSSSLLGLPT